MFVIARDRSSQNKPLLMYCKRPEDLSTHTSKSWCIAISKLAICCSIARGALKILDMGLAVVSDPLAVADKAGMTQNGLIMGTVDYAPSKRKIPTQPIAAQTCTVLVARSIGC